MPPEKTNKSTHENIQGMKESKIAETQQTLNDSHTQTTFIPISTKKIFFPLGGGGVKRARGHGKREGVGWQSKKPIFYHFGHSKK